MQVCKFSDKLARTVNFQLAHSCSPSFTHAWHETWWTRDMLRTMEVAEVSMTSIVCVQTEPGRFEVQALYISPDLLLSTPGASLVATSLDTLGNRLDSLSARTRKLTTNHYHSLPITTTHCHSLPLATTHCHSLPLTTTHCHSLPLTTTHYHSLPLTTTHYHWLITAHYPSLPLPTTHYHSLPLTTTHYHSLPLAHYRSLPVTTSHYHWLTTTWSAIVEWIECFGCNASSDSVVVLTAQAAGKSGCRGGNDGGRLLRQVGPRCMLSQLRQLPDRPMLRCNLYHMRECLLDCVVIPTMEALYMKGAADLQAISKFVYDAAVANDCIFVLSPCAWKQVWMLISWSRLATVGHS